MATQVGDLTTEETALLRSAMTKVKKIVGNPEQKRMKIGWMRKYQNSNPDALTDEELRIMQKRYFGDHVSDDEYKKLLEKSQGPALKELKEAHEARKKKVGICANAFGLSDKMHAKFRRQANILEYIEQGLPQTESEKAEVKKREAAQKAMMAVYVQADRERTLASRDGGRDRNCDEHGNAHLAGDNHIVIQ